MSRKEAEAFLEELQRQADEARKEAGRLIPLAEQVRDEARKQLATKKNLKK